MAPVVRNGTRRRSSSRFTLFSPPSFPSPAVVVVTGRTSPPPLLPMVAVVAHALPLLLLVVPSSSWALVPPVPVVVALQHRVKGSSLWPPRTRTRDKFWTPPPPSSWLPPASSSPSRPPRPASHLFSAGGGERGGGEGERGAGRAGAGAGAASKGNNDGVGAPLRDRDAGKTATVNATGGAEIDAIFGDGDGGAIPAWGDDDAESESESDSMPWSQFQDWAMRDNLPRFTVTIGRRRYAMWRAMIRDVPELHGYDVPFVRRMHARRLSKSKKDQGSTNGATGAEAEVPGVLPLLDDFSFEGDGGASGVAHGVAGVADGCPVRTTPLRDVGVTVPLGYVYTTTTGDGDGDGGRGGGVIAYELGTPATVEEAVGGSAYSMARYGYSGAVLPNLDGVVRQAAAKAKGGRNLAVPKIDDDNAELLVNIGGATAALFAAGAAANLLSHHLTVNVFWV